MKVKTANSYSIVIYHETCKYIRDTSLRLKFFEWTRNIKTHLGISIDIACVVRYPREFK